MCFAPQRRALFRHLNVEKCSVPVSLHFWLRNVLRATTACTFSTSQLLKVVRRWCVLCILTWKCASQLSKVFWSWGVYTFWFGNVLRATTACYFSSLIWPAGSAPAALKRAYFSTLRSHKSLEKHSVSRLSTFLHFRAPGSSFFWQFLFLLLFSSLTLPISAFHLSILSEVWLLNFLRLLFYPH